MTGLRHIFRVALFCIGFWPVSAICQTDSLDGEAWLKRSETEYKEEAYKQALHSVDEAIRIFRQKDSLDRWFYSQRHKALVLRHLHGQPFIALSYIDSCLSVFPHWRLPATREEHLRYCRFLLMQAYIAKQFAEDHVLAKNALEKAYQIFIQELENDTETAKYMFFQLGNAYVRLGEFESAKHVFQAGYAYSKKYNIPDIAKYTDYASLYLQLGEYDEVKRIYLEGLSNKELSEEDRLFTKLGYVEYLVKVADLEGATRINREIEAQLNDQLDASLLDKLPEFQQSLLENDAQIFAAKGECEPALNVYQKSVETEKEYKLGSRRDIAFMYNEIGEIALSCNQIDQALQAFQNALKTMIPGFDAPVEQNPDPSGFTAENTIYKALYGKAQCFEQTGRPDLALECYELIPLVEAKLRATHEYESSTLQALEDSRARLDKAVGLAWQLYETTRDERLAERAFNLTEQIRGVILLESLAKDRNDRQLPDSIQQRQTGIQWKIAWFERKIAEAKLDSTAREKVASLESGLFQAKQELEALKQSIPGHARLEENFTYRKAPEVPALLRPGALLLSYYFTDAALYVFSCTPRQFMGWRKVAVTPEWQETTDAFAQFLTRLDESPEKKRWFLKTAAELYDALLAPELTGKTDVRSLIIIPDDRLSYLPFEVLLTGAASNGPWASFPYLVNRYSVAYNYSATLLSVQQSIEHAAAKSFFAAFTPVYAGDAVDPVSGYRLDNLKKIQEASAAAARKFGGDVFVQDANEDLFKRLAFNYTILVLGMHGFAEMDDPALSRLIIGNPQPRQEQDNVLYTAELRLLRLRARLVVLLACHTGYGQWRKGEGVYSLARAFTMASVPATVMSLWSLPDNSASPLMDVFFEKINHAGAPVDQALQEAKRAYLNNPDYFDLSHPFFWAGLMAMGDAGAAITR